MINFDKYLKKIEKNYQEKEKRTTTEFKIKDDVYEVILPNRSEKIELFLSKKAKFESVKDIFEWLKPTIYKSFQLKNLAIKAKEDGYINTYYEIIELLFDGEDIAKIIDFFLQHLNESQVLSKELEFQKK